MTVLFGLIGSTPTLLPSSPNATENERYVSSERWPTRSLARHDAGLVAPDRQLLAAARGSAGVATRERTAAPPRVTEGRSIAVGQSKISPPGLSSQAQAAWDKSVFGSVPHATSSRLLAQAVELTVEPGQTFYRGAEHEASARVAVVAAGLLRLYVSAPDGRTLTMRYIAVGQVVGLRGLVLDAGVETGSPSLASDTVNGDAVRPSRILHLAKAELMAVVRANATLALALAQEVAAQAMRDQEMLSANLFRSIRSRVALHLLHLSAPSNGELVVTVSHREIADAIGSVREVVTRALDRLQGEGLIARRDGRIVLRQPAQLRGISQS